MHQLKIAITMIPYAIASCREIYVPVYAFILCLNSTSYMAIVVSPAHKNAPFFALRTPIYNRYPTNAECFRIYDVNCCELTKTVGNFCVGIRPQHARVHDLDWY